MYNFHSILRHINPSEYSMVIPISVALFKVTSLKTKKILIVEEGEVAAETSVVEEDLVVAEHLPGRLKRNK